MKSPPAYGGRSFLVQVLAEEVSHRIRNLLGMALQREVSCVEQMDLGTRDIALECFRARGYVSNDSRRSPASSISTVTSPAAALPTGPMTSRATP
jgi:hypothetical protein